MPITIGWYDDQHRAIYERFIGQWTWDDIGELMKQIDEFTATVPWNVSILIDMSDSNSVPSGNALQHGVSKLKISPENIANMIFVIDSQLVKSFATMIFSLSPTWRNKTRFVKTIEEGREIIDKLIQQQNVTG